MSTDPREFDTLWDYANPADTEAAFRQVQSAVEATGDEDLLLQLDTQIARTYGLRGMFEESHAILDTVHDRLRQEHPVAQVRYKLERGRSSNSAGDTAKARALFLEAFDLAETLVEDSDPVPYGSEFHLVDAAHMMGIVEEGDSALAWNERALELADNARDPRARRWRGSLLNNLGWEYHERGDYEKSIDLFTQCRAFHDEAENGSRSRIAQWSIARTLRSMGDYETALELLEVLAADYEGAGEQEMGFVPEEIGECLWALERYDEARSHLSQAHRQLKEVSWVEESRLASLQARAAASGDR